MKNADVMNLEKAREEYRKLCTTGPPPYEKWAPVNEMELEQLSKPFTLKDTELGRHQNMIKTQFISMMHNMTKAKSGEG